MISRKTQNAPDPIRSSNFAFANSMLYLAVFIILAGSSIFYYSIKKQDELISQNISVERKISRINEIKQYYLEAILQKRVYQYNLDTAFLQNYLRNMAQNQEAIKALGLILMDDQEKLLFQQMKDLIDARALQVHEHFNFLNELPFEEALGKIRDQDPMSFSFHNQLLAVFEDFNANLIEKSIAIEKEQIDLSRRKSIGFIALSFASVLIVIGLYRQTKNVSLLQYEKERQKMVDEITLESQKDFSLAFTYASIGMALVSADGKFLRVNKSLCSFLGYNDEELTRLTFQEITHPDDLEVDLEFARALFEKKIESYQIEKRYFTKSGDTVWINLSGTAVWNPDGSLKYFIAQIENINPRKKAFQALENQKNRLSNVIEGTRAGTWEWNVQTGETVFNENWANMIGYTLEELEPISIETWMKFAHPDDLESSNQKLQSCFNKESDYYECESRMLHKNGKWIWVLDRGKVMSWTADEKPVLMYGTHTNITKFKELEFELIKQEAKYKGIFNSTFQFIGFLEPDGTVVEANQTALSFAGLDPKDVLGKKFWDCYWWQISPQTQDTLQKNILRAATGEFVQYEVDVLDSQKNAVSILFNLKPLISENGEVMAIIPEGRLIQDIVEARRALVDKNKELEQFASVASHDLKEPLRMVMSFMQLLKSKYGGKLDEKADKYIDFAVDASKRMNTLINDLLEYSRSGNEEVSMEEIDSKEIVENIKGLYTSIIEEKSAKIHVGNLPVIYGKKLPLTLLFQNLIGNALKYIATDRDPEVWIDSEDNDRQWKFSIRDNGIGIKKENFEVIFKLFKRLHTSMEYSGTGMGLATCKKIVEQHEGTMWVESEEGEGSTFFFTIKKHPTNANFN